MKTVLSVCALLSCCTLLCAQPAPGTAPAKNGQIKTPRVMDAATRSNMLARTGGMLMAPAKGPVLLFLNTQTRVSPSVVGEVQEQLQMILRLPIKTVSKPSKEPVADALTALADKGHAAVIVIGDCAGYPSLLIAPENRWALVNVTALYGDGASAELLADRTRKEVWRAFGYLMGAAHSNHDFCVLKSVLTPTDLDALKPKTLCPEPLGKIMAHSQLLGMTPVQMSTYRKAVEEGWAPAPTNDIQRALWKELKK